MLKNKSHLSNIYRPPLNPSTRVGKICLDKNEAPFSLKDIADERGSQNFHYDFRSYPDPYPLYEKLAGYLHVDIPQLLLTPGSDQAIRLAYELMADTGDEIVYLDPSFAMLDVFCRQYNANNKTIPFPRDFDLDTQKILDAINTKTRLVVVANPNNPTGTYIDSSAISSIARCCKEVGAMFVLDEAYFPYCAHTNGLEILREHENLVITRTFSKAWGLAGIRAGYIVSSPTVISLLRKIKPSYELTYHSINIILKALDYPQLVDLNVSQVNKWKNKFRNIRLDGMEYIESHGNFLLFRFSDSLHSAILNEFDQRGILVKSGMDSLCMKGVIRFSVTSDEIMQDIREFFLNYAVLSK